MKNLPAFPHLVWVLLAGTFLTRTAFFMVWPFLAVILDRQFQLPPAQIGAILALSAVAGAVVGFYSGNLSDRFGRRNIMVAGCLGTIVAYAMLAMAETVAAYTIAAFLVGLCRTTIEAPGNALIADATPDQNMRELAYHARYFLLNVGAAIGPLAVFRFGLAAQQVTFWITAFVYALFLLALVLAFRLVPPLPSPHAAGADTSFAGAVRTMKADRRFLFLLLANFLAYAAYAQQESTLIQYLNREGGVAVLGLLTALITTNALTIVFFQFPLLRLLRRFDLYARTFIGLALFIAGFVSYAFLPVDNFPGWVMGTFVLSLGEAILFPTLSMQIDRLAPNHLKGTYFGASALGSLGFAAGPLMGGFLLQYAGGMATFLLMGLLTLAAGLFYRASRRTAWQISSAI